jgi:lipid A ethanolaminephosphotransferase
MVQRNSPRPRWQVQARSETVVLAVAVFWALSANTPFLKAALHGRELSNPGTWGFVAALLPLLVVIHALLLLPLASRYTLKPLLFVLLPATAFASYAMQSYGIFLDPSMLRNVLRTDAAEARELLTPTLALHLLLYAGLPMLLLWRLRLSALPWPKALLRRLLFAAALLLLGTALLWSIFQPLSSWMRHQKDARYLVTPANLAWSAASAWRSQREVAKQPRQPIGLDAKPGASWAARQRPVVVLFVVGETTRDANWGLSGYARQTTPQLSSLNVASLAGMRACGTNTEVSLPCMFAPVGRRDYDEKRIRSQESLLQVVQRAGVAVHWRDNQSGCKGVCDGLAGDSVGPHNAPGLCADGRCLDEGLVRDLDARLRAAEGSNLWLLHMLGSHGPSYFRRYPNAFAKFQPDCRHDDLQRCSVEQIVNAFDNSVLYTDHVLASAIRQLQAQQDRVDSLLIFVSDHGESLGERGLFLHGMPYPIAPEEQKRVPLVLWASPGFEAAVGLRHGCLAQQLAAKPAGSAAHDHLFHSLLTLLDVHTGLYEAPWDLFQACRADVR